MCLIQAVIFNKNGSENFDCRALQSDNVEVDIVVTIDSAEVGKTLAGFVSVMYPDGIERAKYVLLTPNSTGIFDFMIPIEVARFGTGTYRITEAEIRDYISDTQKCVKRF